MPWNTPLLQLLDKKRLQHAYRTRTALLHGNQRQLQFQNRTYCNFASNDYLGLSHDPHLIAAWQKGAALYGLGSGGSGHIIGYSSVHQALELKLADWLGYPRALILPSGYAANQAVVLGLMNTKDIIIADRLCHASLLEAAQLCGARMRRFAHNCLDALTLRLDCTKESNGKTLVMSEGVFSMDGDKAPLHELDSLCKQHHAWLLLDDAHGIGAYGPQGKGSIALSGVKPDILIVTFGKAFGLSGAAILCNDLCAEYLLHCARHLIYSTAMPIALAYTLLNAVSRVAQADDLRQKLASNITHFRQKANGLPLLASDTAIQPLIVGDNATALRVEAHLRARGFWISAIRPPTVPSDSARLRITLSAFHQYSDITQLVEAIYDGLQFHK